MSASLQPPAPEDTARRSKQVALVLLGTMGVIGGVAVWDAWRRAQPDPSATTAQPEAPTPPVAADRTYQNNDFTPGVGYYHAASQAWFPYPYNHHDPSRGYFAGGLWQALPFAAGLLSSRPRPDAVTAVNSAFAASAPRGPQPTAGAGSSGLAGSRNPSSAFGGSSFSPQPARATPPAARPSTAPAPAARPSAAPAPATSKPSIQRGGFGSAGKSSGGSSGS
jgi:hypothetical protein